MIGFDPEGTKVSRDLHPRRRISVVNGIHPSTPTETPKKVVPYFFREIPTKYDAKVRRT